MVTWHGGEGQGSERRGRAESTGNGGRGLTRRRKEARRERAAYRVRVYAPKRGRPRRGSRSALTYCSTFAAHTNQPFRSSSRANPETQNAAPSGISSSPLRGPVYPSTTALAVSLPSSFYPSPSCRLSIYLSIYPSAPAPVSRI